MTFLTISLDWNLIVNCLQLLALYLPIKKQKKKLKKSKFRLLLLFGFNLLSYLETKKARGG